ncbi:MAG: hypothetical protein CYG60_04210 [Actinobacteria bacterium]|nr:MAG: hypothetical protein CYG60_04210 [Actinomycetota bacterium]
MGENPDHDREEVPGRPSVSRENMRRQAEEIEGWDPNIRAEDYGESPSRPSWWRWIFGGGS